MFRVISTTIRRSTSTRAQFITLLKNSNQTRTRSMTRWPDSINSSRSFSRATGFKVEAELSKLAKDVERQMEEGVSLDGGAEGGVILDKCGIDDDDEDDDDDMEEMFIETPMGLEWGGPTRGGRLAEPTMHGDWSRKGRCTDF